ncbi:MAG: peptidylprolyl isomerase [Arenicellales bacterium]|nr:peptidylprolyl isomerase [Arenicellales bacterium]
MHERSESRSGVWDTLKREPLAHFLSVAALLFIGHAVFSGDGREVITVDVPTQEYLIQQQQELILRPLTEEEKFKAVESFIEEEILVREARKRGFENSSRIRTMLIQNMRFFMASEIPEPTEEDLRVFFEENADRFRMEPSITYDHAFFSNPEDVPPDTLELLRAGADHQYIGDTDAVSAKMIGMTERQVIKSFGRDLAPAILAIEDEQWHGPFASAHGTHFLRVAERRPARMPSFEDARNWLEQEWVMAKNRDIVERELDVMRKNYRIEVLEPSQDQQ